MKAIFDDEYVEKEDISKGLKTLAREELISQDQFNKLMAMVDDGLDMKKLIDVVVNEKIGRGIQFLPRKTKDLHQKLGEWSKIYHEESTAHLKDKILATLHELKFRNAISENDYNSIIYALD